MKKMNRKDHHHLNLLCDIGVYAEQMLAENTLDGVREVMQHFTGTFDFKQTELEVEHDS